MNRFIRCIFILAVSALVAAFPLAAATNTTPSKAETAIFAGGCFWSLETAFEKTYGVISAVSGYSGGRNMRPTYDNYAQNGHVETVRVTFDPSRITYSELLDVYWRHTDPTDGGGSFYDRGPNYRPIIFYLNAVQKAEAEKSKAKLAASGVFSKTIATEIRLAAAFYPAEEYHQDYQKKNPDQYENYFVNSGRKEFFAKTWGAEAVIDPGLPPSASSTPYRKPALVELKKILSAMQFDVTQREGTEPAYDNEFWNDHRAGIFVDIVSGEPLFSSSDKYDSGTGWPSFTRPLVPANVLLRPDTSMGSVRTEVRSRFADSHLGHVFDDGPVPTGLRYCMNSAAMRFIPREEMEKKGYGQFIRFVK